MNTTNEKLQTAMDQVDRDMASTQAKLPRTFGPVQPPTLAAEPRTLPQWLRQFEQRSERIERRLEKLERWLGVE
jgi:hypothetical protein